MPVVTDSSTAVKKIPKGRRIFIGSGAAVPLALTDALAKNASHFSDNQIVHLLTLGTINFLGKEFKNHFRDNSFFIGDNVRKAVQSGEADYTPIFLSEIPRLLKSGSFRIGAALVMVSPPDNHNMCSLGVSVDIGKAAIEGADIVIAQINRNMPRTFGQTMIPYKKFDYVVEADTPLPELPLPKSDHVIETIGKNIAQLISDGSVLQLGIGGIPNAVLLNLKDKNDLGIHTEMFSDGIIDLMKNGNITNTTKKILSGRTATSFCFGTRDLYDYVHDNPLVEFYPSDFMNDPFRISQNDNMVAVNSAIQIDLTGQVCADSLGPKFYSGIGGQVDFIRGAARSKRGKPIIAFPSTAKKGEASRIVGQLSSGAGVVTSRGDVRFVVTEYGITNLFGKSIRQRALELIQLAHPKFRDELMTYVKGHRYVYFDQKHYNKTKGYPTHMEEVATFSGQKFRARPIRISDEGKLQEFFYSHHEETLYQRYLYLPKAMPHEIAQKLVDLDYNRNMALVILEAGEFSDRIIAVGRLAEKKAGGPVELSFIVHDDFQGKGMGKYLCRKLFDFAKERKIQKITAFCLLSNDRMRAVLEKLGNITPTLEALVWGFNSKISHDVIYYTFELAKGREDED